MARGDQIYVIRPFAGLSSVYEHHGIDCGDHTVIHYRKAERVIVSRTSLESFTWGRSIYVKHYPTSFIAEDVIRRAESRLGEEAYHLLTNNCEHFATWCKTGRSESQQLTRFGVSPIDFQARDLSPLIRGLTPATSVEETRSLVGKAFENIAIAHRTLQSQIDQHRQECHLWQRIARLALARGREDLAREALIRKRSHQVSLDHLTDQMSQLDALNESLEQQSSSVT